MADQGITEGTGPADGSNPTGKAPETAGVPSTPAVSAPQQNAQSDIAKILEEVKLPERRGAAPQKQIENTAATFDTQLGAPQSASEAPPPQDGPGVTPTPPPQKDNITPVHTLKDDLQNLVQDEKMSLVHAASLEEDKRHRVQEEIPRPVTRTSHPLRALAIASVALLVLLGAGWFAFRILTASIPAQNSGTSLIFAESSLGYSLQDKTPDEIKQTLAGARAAPSGAIGTITRIVPTVEDTAEDGTKTTRPATLQEFLAALGTHAPDALTRALSSEFFFGIHTVDKQAPLLVIPVLSYERAFAGMLAWESTMNADLSPVFTAVPNLTRDQNGLPVQRTFQDKVLQNYDTRVLVDDAGQTELYYSFPTQHILIIAESPYSFTEILSRLQAARAL